ncbi:Piso0_002259 [Millerozyma farinosa CBS 7064]|uniref:Piso0_002259 protein n=1 Tax=Pichia sorbitophila (strain ATCC MYA-4447 / BCRC 22081 / CBS 7064 / NBRC 10061 / NRRL Y-12695) TaxID=559304 RepID=G8YEJ9_PICSO|nr:Piso0_002259 [Millerozyma farinosa CBS 7064]
MWPFSSGSGKDTSEVLKEIPDGLRDFFEEQNPDKRFEGDGSSPYLKRINEVLSRETKNVDSKVDNYKRRENLRVVTGINCAELQQKVLECMRGWSYTQGKQCAEEIQNNTKCVSIQHAALKKLHYEDCYSIEHCKKIRFIVDMLFTKHYGRYGTETGEDVDSKFAKELDKSFFKVWK